MSVCYTSTVTLDTKLEAILFYKAEPVKKAELASFFGVKETEVETALDTLKERLKTGGTMLVMTEGEVELATRPELDELIEELRKDEMKRDIGKAGAETLAIVLYNSPVSRGDVERIRGVNSSYILRSLEIRGLIERATVGRKSEFRPTTALLRHLGVGGKTELKDFADVMNALEKFETATTTEAQAT